MIEASLIETMNPMVRPVAVFALETAMRLGEILALQWIDIDLHRRLATIPLSKNGRSRIVPLSDLAVSTLISLPGCDERVFPTSASAMKQAWRRIIRRAGIRDLHFHDLRHEAISRLFEKGLALPEVALVSGHSDPRQLMRYTHLEASRIAEKIRSIG
jgi:integrase